MTNNTNNAKGAGRWYPGRRLLLEVTVDDFMERAQVPLLRGRMAAAIAPHAGYMYSGFVAGHVYRAVRDQARSGLIPDTTVVLGFSHRASFPGLALMEGDALVTPLGPAPLDEAAASQLTEQSRRIFFGTARHGDEHSAENQIPFLQAALPGGKLVIGLMGDRDPATIEACADALSVLAGERNILVIASTDLLHDPDYDRVTRTDRETLALMAAMDETALTERWRYENQVCCGLAPVLTAMRFARAQGAKRGLVLTYRNSGDDFPESRGQWVVGYGAVAYPCSKTGQRPQPK